MDKLIGKKIKRSTLFIGCLFLSLKMTGQDISLKKIKTENIFKAQFYFEMTNCSNAIKVYSVSLESCGNDNNWHEIKGDVFNNTATKKTRTFKYQEIIYGSIRKDLL